MKQMINQKNITGALFALLLLLGLGIRLYDLTDLPLDFAPTRQLFSALKARGMYYAMLPEAQQGEVGQLAIRQWKGTQVIEPTIIEGMAALAYRAFGEQLWFGRLFSSLFWVLGAIPLYLLAKKMGNALSALLTLGVYLFLPYGAEASRAIQPDPMMVSLIVFGLWASYNWLEKDSMKWAIVAGVFNGLAMLVKNVAVFPLLFALLPMLLQKGLLFHLRNRKTWTVALLSALPTLAYTLYGVFAAGFLGQQFAFRFFPNLWSDPVFYLRWKNQIDGVIGFPLFLAAFCGFWLAKGFGRRLLAGWWLGYLLYGLTFAYHITSHDYYQLPLIPLVALSLAPLGRVVSDRLRQQPHAWVAAIAISGALGFALLASLWTVRVDLARGDFRPEAARWQMIGAAIGKPSHVLTISEDYGYRLAYWGMQDVEAWLEDADLNLRELDGRQIDLEQKFAEKVANKDYIVITQMNKLDNQPEIKQLIEQTYPVIAQGDGFVIYDVKTG